MRKLFGTDGIRGYAGRSPLTLSEVKKLGQAAGEVLHRKYPQIQSRILIVRDTRKSGQAILQALSAGLRERGVDVFDGEILNTPSVAYLVKAHRFQSGVVISASHNPPPFNGIKFFNSHGRKWPDEWEEEVENLFFGITKIKPPSEKIPKGTLIPAHRLIQDYEDFLISTLRHQGDLSGLKVAVDCSNGANSLIAPRLLKRLKAKVFVTSNNPNGGNINMGCGSQHTGKLSALVRKNRCDVGVAFDGDGDRVIFVDEKGKEIDGDFIIALLTKILKKKNKLKNRKVVITVMANLGLVKVLSRLNIKPIVTPVGDRHVSQAMGIHKSYLGGEQSGHIILGEYLSTGDGLLTAIHILTALKKSPQPFSKLVGFMKKFPQILLNIPVRAKIPIEKLNGVSKKILKTQKILGKNGRVLVRYSGTEPLLRIMLEGPQKKQLTEWAEDIARSVKNAQ